MKIDEKQEKWLDNSEIELSKNIKELSNNASIKSNFIIAEFNFELLKKFIIKLLKYVKYLRKTFDTENIMHDVLTEIQNKKLIIPIEYNIQIGETKTKDIADYQYLVDLFGKENLFHIEREEMYNMCSNVFSISPEVVVSEKNFTRLNQWLRSQGFTVEEIPYSEIAKQEGLLRCSTLPLCRTTD